MSRERRSASEIGDEREQALTTDRGGGAGGDVAVDRIAATETFWAALDADTRAHDKHAIDALLLSTYRAGDLGRLVRNATGPQLSILHDAFLAMDAGGHDRGTDVALWEIFCNLPDSSPGMKRICFQVRWRLNVHARDVIPEQEEEWDAPTLRRLWLILSRLPNSHTEDNQRLVKFIRYHQGSKNVYGGGYYSSSKDIAAVNYDVEAIPTTTQKGTSQVKGDDPLEDVNRFDKVVRHEVGHAVDAKLGISDRYCPRPEGGGWARPSLEDWLGELAHDAGLVIPFMFEGMGTRLLADAIRGLDPKNVTVDELYKHASYLQRTDQTTQLLGVIVKALTDQTWGYSDTPAVHGRSRAFFHDGTTYYSYDLVARTRQVSNYQFKTPYEWAAEAYAAYYEPDPRGLGAKLAERDPHTKRWFDEHVHNR